MRKIGLFLALLAVTMPALAQSGPPPPNRPPVQNGAMGNGDINGELKNLTQALGLSGAQQAEARRILTDRQAQILAVRAEFPAPRPGAAPPPGGPVKMRAVMNAAHQRMLSILTPAQQAKYNQLDNTGNGPPPAAPG